MNNQSFPWVEWKQRIQEMQREKWSLLILSLSIILIGYLVIINILFTSIYLQTEYYTFLYV